MKFPKKAADNVMVGKRPEIKEIKGGTIIMAMREVGIGSRTGKISVRATRGKINPRLQAKLNKIKWIDLVGGKNRRIMKYEVPVSLFKLVMKKREITGHNADKLRSILVDPAQENKALTFVNLFDTQEFARKLSILTGREFRIPTNEEWEGALNKLCGFGYADGAVRSNYTWTETNGAFCLRIIGRFDTIIGREYSSRCFTSAHEIREENTAIRLVEVL